MKYKTGDIIGCKKIIDIYRNKYNRECAKTQCIYCGKICNPNLSDLKYEKHQSCICKLIKHGMRDSRIYHTYSNMKYRCYNSNFAEFHNYGGKGIKVCDEWLGEDGFINFYNWAINNGYNDNLTIDRIDSDKDYCPKNCQWITRSENTIKSNKILQHRKANKGNYYAISPSGEYYEFQNAAEFGRNIGIDGSKIRGKATNHIKNLVNGWDFGYTYYR